MHLRISLAFSFLVAAVSCAVAADDATAKKPPNIVVILADDLGYGDVACNNPERGKIPTPNIDAIAAAGMRFTDGHSSSGVCTPSRYSLLTGRYHWRSRLQKGIVSVGEHALIAPDRKTIADLLKENGYSTAAIGKWHLGWNWAKNGKEINYSKTIGGGPIACGFDRYFGVDVPNWPPYAFIENDHIVGQLTKQLPKADLKNHRASLPGPALQDWSLERVLPTLCDCAVQTIGELASKEQPYFIYLALTTPHTPIAVNKPWKGKSGLSPYADLVMETDSEIGRVLKAIEDTGEEENTLVVFTSDNGCAPYIGVAGMESKGHYPSGPLRGYKSDVLEGGHRVPFLVRWPAVVKAGSKCDQLVLQADLLATCMEIAGKKKLADDEGEDSVSFLSILQGNDKPVRETAISQSVNGVHSIRRGDWKLIFAPGSGGWTKGASDQPGQLYNLREDLGETKNLFASNPEKVSELTALMEKQISQGRSTPGAPQKNDTNVQWKPVK